jgi:hypothetical protein
MINQREQDCASKAYLRLLKTTLTRFAAKFPGDLIEVDTHQIDAWLRSLDVAARWGYRIFDDADELTSADNWTRRSCILHVCVVNSLLDPDWNKFDTEGN